MVVQLVPFHCSASVSVSMPTPLSTSPTAMQSVGETHATPLRLLTVGLGVFSTVQLVPFQRSANVENTLPLLSSLPTAVQAPAEVHDTSLRSLAIAPDGTGGLCKCQPIAEIRGTGLATALCASTRTADATTAPASTRRPVLVHQRTALLLMSMAPGMIAPSK